MREMGVAGGIRGKPVRMIISDKTAPCPRDHLNRQFYAPVSNMLWASDFTYVAIWAGLGYAAFVIDTYARRIVGWLASRTAHAGVVLNALEQIGHDRRPIHRGSLVHHRQRGPRYVFIKYIDRPTEAGIAPPRSAVLATATTTQDNQRPRQRQSAPPAQTLEQLRSCRICRA